MESKYQKILEERFLIECERFNITILLDNKPLFEKHSSYWTYIYEKDGIINSVMLNNLDDKYLNIFLMDICEQIENGISRNDLTINIPKVIDKIKIGNKTVYHENN